MTGAEIVGAVLRAADAVIATVAVARIKGGKLPDDVALPALLVRTISSIERQKLKRTGKIRTVDRVSVTVRAASYAEQLAVIKAVKDACAGQTGNVGGAESVSILNAGSGPDLIGPGDTFEQATDFRVSFDA
jgi:hypothetical protein